MADKTDNRVGQHPAGNVGVHVGTLLILVAYCMPWVISGGYSALSIAVRPETAAEAFVSLNLNADYATTYTRILYMVPLVAISTLMVELSVPPRHAGRVIARLSVLVAGATLSAFFIGVGLEFGSSLAFGFWAALMGAMFVMVGTLFNVFRGE